MRDAPVVLIGEDVKPARGRGRERAQALVDGRIAVAHLWACPCLAAGSCRHRAVAFLRCEAGCMDYLTTNQKQP